MDGPIRPHRPASSPRVPSAPGSPSKRGAPSLAVLAAAAANRAQPAAPRRRPERGPEDRSKGWDTSFNTADRRNPLGQYEALRDAALQGYFTSSRRVRGHLQDQGFLTTANIIVPDVAAKQKVVEESLAYVEQQQESRRAKLSRALAARLVHNRREEDEAGRRREWEARYARARWRRDEHRRGEDTAVSPRGPPAAAAIADAHHAGLPPAPHSARGLPPAPLRPTTAGSSRPSSARRVFR